MTTAPPASKAMPQARNQDKFSLEKATFDGITLLTLHGTLNEAFEGRKIAESIRTRKLVVNMRDVRRFASWGMSEWMDFLRTTADRDLYLAECSTYALSQINLVTGLLGHGKLVSFYAAYRCGSCSEERETLFIIPRDRAGLRDLPGSYQVCATCGGNARIEEYPAAFFDRIAERPSFDIDDEVLAFLRSHFSYYDLTPDLTRFRAFRKARAGYTYLRVSGNLATLPGEALAAATEGTVVVDLAGIVFEPAQLSEWRTFLPLALTRVKSLQLLNCPPGFLEYAVAIEELGDKLKVRTFAIPYDCLRCETQAAYLVDVAENLEQLVAGIAPAAYCPTCQSQLMAAVTAEQMAFMRALPARDRDPALDKFLAAAREEPADKLENALAPAPPKPARAGANRKVILIAAGASLLFMGALFGIAVVLRNQGNGDKPAVATQPAITTPSAPTKPAAERPEWIVSDELSSAYCHDQINRLMCVGLSAYRSTRDEAAAEASDAALEELVSAIGLKITDGFIKENVVSGYSAVRSKALSALQAADLERGSAANPAIEQAVAKARRRVVESLRASGGAAVPAQRTDWYWERYEAKKGGDEFLVFVRYDVPLDAVKALVERYSAPTTVLGSTVVTAFPALAWQHPDFTGGAMLTKIGYPLNEAGLQPQNLLVAVGDQRVDDVVTLVKRIDEWKQAAGAAGALKLTVKAGADPARAVEIARPKVR